MKTIALVAPTERKRAKKYFPLSRSCALKTIALVSRVPPTQGAGSLDRGSVEEVCSTRAKALELD